MCKPPSYPIHEPGVLKKCGKKIEGVFASIKQHYICHRILHTPGVRDILNSIPRKADFATIGADAPIWIFWWQGEENMPAVTRACYRSVHIHANHHPIHLVSKDNYQQYAELPAEIVRKFREKQIDITHFSDIIRMYLLSHHGGIWLDATVFLTHDIDTFIPTTLTFWSCKHKSPYHNIARGHWVSFFVACGKGNPLTKAIYDLHVAYWRNHNDLIVYLLLDYMFALCYKHSSLVRQMIQQVPKGAMGPLGKCMDAPYAADSWTYFSKRFYFHKLTYKLDIPSVLPNGKSTYLGYLLKNYQS